MGVLSLEQELKRCIELLKAGQRDAATVAAHAVYRGLQDPTDRDMFVARMCAYTKQDHDDLRRVFEQGLSPTINGHLWNVGALGWLDPTNPPPTMPCLLTVPHNGKAECFLPLGRTAMLAAPGGTGKTQALMQLAVSVATGKPWLDTYKVAAPGPVLVLMGEEDQDEFRRRLTGCVNALGDLWRNKEAMGNLGRNLYALPLYGTDVMLTDEYGQETDFARRLMERLQEGSENWRLVILDPASRFMGPECELDNKAATTWIECLERMTKVRGNPSVMFAHHMNKGGLNGETDQGAARGSSALTDGARWQANLDVVLEDGDDTEKKKDGALKRKTDPNRCTLRVVKSNYGPRPGPLELERDGTNGGHLKPSKVMANTARVML